MQINWKEVCKSPGYISLKAAYIRDVQECENTRRRRHPTLRNKTEFLKKFNWIINRAKHYAEWFGIPIEIVLKTWEDKRTYWWLNYYQNCNQPKFNSKKRKPMGLKGIKKYYKKVYSDPERIAERINSFVQHKIREKNKGNNKPRWSNAHKKRGY